MHRQRQADQDLLMRRWKFSQRNLFHSSTVNHTHLASTTTRLRLALGDSRNTTP
jgi:hypothetical protein